MTHKNGGATRLTTSRTYDALDRLLTISNVSSGSDPMNYAYQYDAAGQRERVTRENGDYWSYAYNSRGEVTGGVKKLAAGTAIPGYQYSYDFDDIGNRTTTSVNGRSATYSPNALNQYTSPTVPGAVDVLGTALPGATVTVNGNSPTRGADGSYYEEISVTNTSTAVYQPTTVTATLGADTAQVDGNLFVPKTPEAFTYDDDGNLLSDGRWTYTWNGENRLIGMETSNLAAAAGAPRQRLAFTYDYMGRRIAKSVESWNGLAYVPHHTLLFLYQGWNLAAELLASTGQKIRSYTWGANLSGGDQGGGLLFVEQQPENKVCVAGYDGNGNVVGMFDLIDGSSEVTYEYGLFGEPLVVSGSIAEVNPFRFSTKYVDNESGLSYYGYRFYNPTLGRWLNRDPIEEEDSMNLYEFAVNNGINKWDLYGLLTLDEAEKHWRDGTGTPLHIGLDEAVGIDVQIHDFPTVRAYINSTKKGDFNIDDRYVYSTQGKIAAVLGSITLRLQGKLSLCGVGQLGIKRHYTFKGNLKSFADSYDFDMHSGQLIRNALTVLGRLHAGPGKKYLIYIDGSRNMDVAR